jgi:hypothetical protein
MLQTAGPSMDIEFMKMILSKIARLRKMPDLAEQIMKYQPQPNPLAQMEGELKIELLKAQIAKENALAQKHIADAQAAGGRGMRDASQADLNTAKAGEAESKAKLHSSEADQADLDYLQKSDGTMHKQNLEMQNTKDNNALVKELAKVQTKPTAGIEARADGGPIEKDSDYLVGEKGLELKVDDKGASIVGAHGPEVITAKRDGVVIPNNGLPMLKGSHPSDLPTIKGVKPEDLPTVKTINWRT